MRTFTGTYSGTFRIVVTDDLVAEFRKEAQTSHSKALAAAHAAHPTNDEAFVEQVIKGGLRAVVKCSLADAIYDTPGMGGTVSPAKIEIVGLPADAAQQHVEPQVLEVRHAG